MHAMTTQSDNDDKSWPFVGPRVAGVREHYERVKFFHGLGQRCPGPVGQFRLLLAGLYSAQAVVELMLTAAEKEEVNLTRENMKAHLRAKIPWFDLIERIRIHDFHRFGLVPPDPQLKVMMLGGPVKLKARKGAAIYRVTDSGPEKLTTGTSEIQEHRPLLINDGRFFDDATRTSVSLDQILQDFIPAAVNAIEEFETNLRKESGGKTRDDTEG